MNHIICDICGSEYPEGYDRCPICSYPRQGGEKIVAAGAVEAVQSRVKGGRFSAKNVKKRRKAQEKAAQAASEPAAPQVAGKNPNRPLWITIVILLIAILLVGAYIGLRFGRGLGFFPPAQTTASATTMPTQITGPVAVPCSVVTLDTTVIALDEVGQQQQIGVKLIPQDTTDVLTFQTGDPAIAEVSADGLLTAVGSGQTTITISCGQIIRECTVVCWFPEETTAPAETTAPTAPPETTKATEPPKATQPPKETKPPKATEPEKLTLDQSDVSCFTRDEVFTLSVKLGSSSVSRSKVTWSTSDPAVATVDGGKVVAVGKGTATITAEYEGKKATCVVRCRFDDTSWKPSATDVTLALDESFRLTVTNSSGETADAIWTMSVDGVVSIKGKTVTGKAPGTVTLTTTVDGVTMTCIVRVK